MPAADAALLLRFSLVASGQITVRRLDGGREIDGAQPTQSRRARRLAQCVQDDLKTARRSVSTCRPTCLPADEVIE